MFNIREPKKEEMIMKLFFVVVFLFSFTYLVGQNTGGFANVSSGGTSVTVSNASQFLDYISRSGSYTINISGTIYLSGMNDVSSNKTIRGGTIAGGGLDIDGVNNVVIQNVAFRDWDDDAINVQDGSTHIWVDHCSFSNGYDGAVDIKRGSDFVTVSWNHFFNHGKTCLLGHSDSNGSQDIGHLRVTYHHNYFDGTGSRHPRVRFSALCHVYNNYYRDNDYGVASTMNAEVLVEGNYFQDCGDPTLVGYGSSGDGDLVQRNNVFAGSTGSPETRGSVPNPPYSYSLDNASNIPGIVSANAGPGGGGGSSSYIRLQNRTTGLYIDGMGRTSNGSACGQWSGGSSHNQQWTIENAGSYIRLRNRATGLYLDGMGRTSNGSDAGQWSNSNHQNQQWAQESSGGYVRFRNRATGLYLDGMGRTSNGSNLGQWSSSSHTNQQWSVVSVAGSRIADTDAGQEETLNVPVRVFPNPVSQNRPVTISLPAISERVSLEVTDLSGRTMLKEHYLSVDEITLDHRLETGIYTLQLTADGVRSNYKLIVQ